VKIHTLRIRRDGFGNFREISNGHNLIVSNRNSRGVRILRIPRENLGIKKYPLAATTLCASWGALKTERQEDKKNVRKSNKNKPESIHEMIILSLPIESGTCT